MCMCVCVGGEFPCMFLWKCALKFIFQVACVLACLCYYLLRQNYACVCVCVCVGVCVKSAYIVFLILPARLSVFPRLFCLYTSQHDCLLVRLSVHITYYPTLTLSPYFYISPSVPRTPAPLSSCLPVYLSVSNPTCLFIYVFLQPSYLPVIYLLCYSACPVCLSFCLFNTPPACLSACLRVQWRQTLSVHKLSEVAQI